VFDCEKEDPVRFAFVWDVFSTFEGPFESPFVEVVENVFTEGEVFVFTFNDEDFFVVDDGDCVSFFEEDFTDGPTGVTGFGKAFDDAISFVLEDFVAAFFLLEEETTLSEDDGDDDDVGDGFVVPFATLCFAATDGLSWLILVAPLEPEDVRSLADELFGVDMFTRSPTIDDVLELDDGELVLDDFEFSFTVLALALGLLLVGVD
jgi:hypothetical protein